MTKRLTAAGIAGVISVFGLFAGGDSDAPGSGGKPVLIYSPQSEEDVTYILEAAAGELDFGIEILRLDGGALSDRLIAEARNPQADVVFGLVPLSMHQLKNENILAPYTPSWAEDLPEVYQDPEHYFHSFWQTPIVLAYNARAMSAAEAPKSWLDLSRDEYAGRYAIGSTSWQTVRTYLAGILWRYYDTASGEVAREGWDFLRNLYENARDYPAQEVYYQEAADGTMPLILNWLGGVERGADLNDIDITFIDTEGGTPVIAEAIALVNRNETHDNARAFIDWFGNPEFQAAMARDMGKSPAHPAALAESPPEIEEKLAFFSPQNIDWGVVAANLDGWLEKIELEIIP